ncbi:MAG: ATP-binding cassette domain-containing protein [Polyangiales bacterium]
MERGESVAVLGTSGSGKSTLLHVMGGLDVGYEGEARLDGKELKSLSDDFLAALRQRTVGFVAPGLSPRAGVDGVRQNVAPPRDVLARPRGRPRREGRRAAGARGLGGRGDDDPSALGRAAAARGHRAALLLEPPLLLCDEPTGSLDHATGESVLALDALHRERGLTLVVVTHEARATALAKRVVRLEEGRVVEDAKKGDDA